MTLAVLQASVLQTNGALSVAAGAQITVRTPAGALVTLYEDRAGTTPTGANPIFADSKGFFRVYVAPGRYDVTVTTSSGTQAYKDIALFADGSVIGTAAAANILGTVSATGTYPNLVPTGAIMEAGSNANGQYVKYADGTMICTHAFSVTAETGVANAFGTTAGTMYFKDTTWTYPAAFAVRPRVSSGGDGDRTGGFTDVTGSMINTTSATHRVWRTNTSVAQSVTVIAIGRWK